MLLTCHSVLTARDRPPAPAQIHYSCAPTSVPITQQLSLKHFVTRRSSRLARGEVLRKTHPLSTPATPTTPHPTGNTTQQTNLPELRAVLQPHRVPSSERHLVHTVGAGRLFADARQTSRELDLVQVAAAPSCLLISCSSVQRGLACAASPCRSLLL